MLNNHPPLARSVLVVDDEPALRSFAAELLRDLGYSAVLAESGRVAVQLLLQDPEAVGAVLLDITMPGMTPEETFRQLTEIRPGLPVIILSGDLESAVRKRFGSDAIAGYIEKPYTDVELEAALAQALDRPPSAEPAAFQPARLAEHELKEIAHEYLGARELELPRMAERLAAGDFESLRALGHNLKGGGGCFGFPELTRIGMELESYAEASDAVSCGRQLNLLKEHLKTAAEASSRGLTTLRELSPR